VKRVPSDISEKRAKVQQRAEKKKVEVEKPKAGQYQRAHEKDRGSNRGDGLLESLITDLIRSGLGTLNAKICPAIEEQARQLGNAYLPAPRMDFMASRGCSNRSEISSEDELKTRSAKKCTSAALDQLNRLHSLCKQGRKYLQTGLTTRN